MKKILLFIFSILLVTLSIKNVYAVETHTVTFVTGVEDIIMEPFEVEDGDTINDKGINFYPEREGYAYPEWYTDSNFTNEFDYEMKFYEDTTLYAKWLISIEEIRITSDLTNLTDGEILPEFNYSLTTENLTISQVEWYSDDEELKLGDKVNSNIEYSIYMSAKANEGYTLEDAIVYFNGEEVGQWIAWPLSMGGAEIGGTFFIPIEVKPSLRIIKKTDTYTIGDSTNAEFEIDADYDNLFKNGGEVYIDGSTEPLDHKNYDSRKGSTIITLKDTYVSTLSEGEHTLKVVFNNNQAATTSFNVIKNNTNTSQTPINNGATINNPQTSDNIVYFIIMLGLSLIGLIKTVLYTRKKLYNK